MNDFVVCGREVSLEFSKSVKEMTLQILEAISEGLEVESDYMYKALDLKHGLFQLAANYYPACPQPEKAIGIPHHTDPGLITFLMENDISGLQVKHNDKWVKVNVFPNSIVVNLADFMEVSTYITYVRIRIRIYIYIEIEILISTHFISQFNMFLYIHIFYLNLKFLKYKLVLI